jgi:hypothetical protein
MPGCSVVVLKRILKFKKAHSLLIKLKYIIVKNLREDMCNSFCLKFDNQSVYSNN